MLRLNLFGPRVKRLDERAWRRTMRTDIAQRWSSRASASFPSQMTASRIRKSCGEGDGTGERVAEGRRRGRTDPLLRPPTLPNRTASPTRRETSDKSSETQ